MCDCNKTTAPHDPFGRFIPGVLGCQRITTQQVIVPAPNTAERVQIVSPLKNRRTVTIVNAGTGLVYIGNEGVNPNQGFPLAAGAGLTLDTAGDVWACGDPTAPTAAGSIATIAEVADPERCSS